jgi:hypothetical protein
MNMSLRVKRFAPLLRSLYRSSGKTRAKILKSSLDKDFLLCLCECCKNVIKGNVPLNPRQKKLLHQYRSKLRKLASKKTSLLKKKKIVQTGGFLGALLSPIISVLSGLLGGSQWSTPKN